MRRALLAAAALALAGCAQQDAALLVTFTGQYRIPTDADTLVIDVFDGTAVIKHLSYPLTTATPLPATLTLVQAGAQHPHVRINGTLKLTQGGQTATVGLGTSSADFQSGQTATVTVTLVPPT